MLLIKKRDCRKACSVERNTMDKGLKHFSETAGAGCGGGRENNT